MKKTKEVIEGYSRAEVLNGLVELTKTLGRIPSERKLKRYTFLPYSVMLKFFGQQKGYVGVKMAIEEELRRREQVRAERQEKKAQMSIVTGAQKAQTPVVANEQEKGAMTMTLVERHEEVVKTPVQVSVQVGKCSERQNKAEISVEAVRVGSDQAAQEARLETSTTAKRKPRLSVPEQEQRLREFMQSLGGRVPTVAEVKEQAEKVYSFPSYQTLLKNFGPRKKWLEVIFKD